MKKILILGAGGVAGVGMTRCLKDFDVYGIDDGKWAIKMMESKPYTEIVDLTIGVPDSLVKKSSYVWRPKEKEIDLCQDKAECAKVLGDLAPETYWVRDTHGAGGKGAQMASEYLPGHNYSVELVYKDGKLYGEFQKERLSYSVKDTDLPLDKRGSSAVSICINNQKLHELSLKAINKISDNPNGVYAIDFKENEQGEPKITEINAGRFLTASYVYFYSTGYNLPKLMVELVLNLPLTPLEEYPEGIGVIRQTDKLPYVGKL
jgi:hypothetical protein